MTEKYIKCKGFRLCYVDEGQGETLVFLHNGGGFWQIWSRQLHYFAQTHRVIAFDLPGYGKSSACDEPRILTLYTSVLADFIQKLGLKDVNLIGNCIGSAVAIFYQQQNPENVKHLVLMNICPGDRLYPSRLFSRFLLFIEQNSFLKRLFCYLNAPFLDNRWSDNLVLKRVFSEKTPQSDPIFQQYKTQLGLPKPVLSQFNLLFAVRSYSLRFFLKPSEKLAKSLVIWGQHNRTTPLETDGYYHKKMLNAEKFHVIPSGSHLCFYENAEQVNRLIEAHLQLPTVI